MKIYEDKTVVLEFNGNTVPDEVQILKELFKKLNEETMVAGFKKKFNQDEIELIRGIYDYFNQ